MAEYARHTCRFRPKPIGRRTEGRRIVRHRITSTHAPGHTRTRTRGGVPAATATGRRPRMATTIAVPQPGGHSGEAAMPARKPPSPSSSPPSSPSPTWAACADSADRSCVARTASVTQTPRPMAASLPQPDLARCSARYRPAPRDAAAYAAAARDADRTAPSALPAVNSDIRAYFINSYDLYESLFSAIAGPRAGRVEGAGAVARSARTAALLMRAPPST